MTDSRIEQVSAKGKQWWFYTLSNKSSRHKNTKATEAHDSPQQLCIPHLILCCLDSEHRWCLSTLSVSHLKLSEQHLASCTVDKRINCQGQFDRVRVTETKTAVNMLGGWVVIAWQWGQKAGWTFCCKDLCFCVGRKHLFPGKKACKQPGVETGGLIKDHSCPLVVC